MKVYSQKEISELVYPSLDKLLSAFEYARDHSDGIMYKYYNQYYNIHLNFGLSENSGFFYKTEGFGKKVYIIDDVWKDQMAELNIVESRNRETFFFTLKDCFPEYKEQPYYDKLFDAIKCSCTDDGVEQYLRIIKWIFENYFFPTLEKYNNILEIDKLINSKIELSQENFGFLGGGEGALFRRIVIAKLANNPNYESIVNYYRDNFAKIDFKLMDDQKKYYYLRTMSVFEEVYTRLKKIYPLDNPLLT